MKKKITRTIFRILYTLCQKAFRRLLFVKPKSDTTCGKANTSCGKANSDILVEKEIFTWEKQSLVEKTKCFSYTKGYNGQLTINQIETKLMVDGMKRVEKTHARQPRVRLYAAAYGRVVRHSKTHP